MKRLIRPLVYILGFSVFCACTTTRAVDLSSIEPGEKVGGLVWVTMREDGSRVLLRDAYRTKEGFIGLDDEGVNTEIPISRISEVGSLEATPVPLFLALSVVGAIAFIAAALAGTIPT